MKTRDITIFVIVVMLLVPLRRVLLLPSLGLSGLNIVLVYYAVLFAGAFAILRQTPWWSPKGTRLWPLLPGLAALLAVPMFTGYLLGFSLRPQPPLPALMQTLAMQVFLVAAAEELFFREAAVKVFGRARASLYLLSITGFFMIHLPQGFAVALIAAAMGAILLALRVAGVWIVLLMGLHAASNVIFGKLLSIGLSQSVLLGYAVAYFAVAVLFLAGVHSRFKA